MTRRSLLALPGFLPLAANPAPPRILVHGHRGARARRPENTLPAFEYALGLGVDALEMDIAVTRDNVIVLSHDPILQPPICSGPQPKAVIRS
jgi:glycerophosphoryl diester phosphodiesterase